jgi:hypothetical protein
MVDIDWAAPLSEEELAEFRELSKTKYGRLRVYRFLAHRDAQIAKGGE